MTILILTDIDVASQLSLLWRGLNAFTPFKARYVCLKQTYLDYQTDILASPDRQQEISEAVASADFFIFGRTLFDFPFAPIAPKLNRNNHLVVVYGTEARQHPEHYCYMWLRKDLMIVGNYDYTCAAGLGFSAQHIPPMYNPDEIPPKQAPPDGVIRIAHTPTSRQVKGTEFFLKAVEELKKEGLPVEPILVEGKPWKECLQLKRQAEIMYDQMSLGCYGMCLLPGQSVLVNPHLKTIEEIHVGDKVMTGTGYYRKVKAVASRFYHGKVVKVTPWNFAVPLTVTEEHKVLAVKPLKRCLSSGHIQSFKPHWNNINGRTGWRQYRRERLNYTPSWIRAGDLEKGDFVFYPITRLQTIKRRRKLRIIDFIPAIQKKGYVYPVSRNRFGRCRGRGKIPAVIPLDKEIVHLCGLYVAEGSSTHGLSFAFHKAEVELAQEVKTAIRELFHLTPSERVRGSCREVWVNSRLLKRLFRAWFGEKAPDKRVPSWVFQLDDALITEFLRYAFKGDGNPNEPSNPRQYPGYAYTSVSKTLAVQLFNLLLRLGIIPTLGAQRLDGFSGQRRRVNGGRRRYVVRIHGEQLKKLMFFETPITPRLRKSHAFFWQGEKMLCLPIRDVTTEEYTGPVYDIQIHHHSFVGEGMIVHNSAIESWAMEQAVLGHLSHWVRSFFPHAPIVEVTPQTLKDEIATLVKNPDVLRMAQVDGKAHAERFHDWRVNMEKWEHLIRFVHER